jgi:hypothetical protein
MSKKRFVVLLVVAVTVIVFFTATPSGRWILYGLSRGEGFYEFKPTSYWIELLKDEDPKVQKKGVDAIWNIRPKSPDVIPPLIAMIKLQSNEDALGMTRRRGKPR